MVCFIFIFPDDSPSHGTRINEISFQGFPFSSLHFYLHTLSISFLFRGTRKMICPLHTPTHTVQFRREIYWNVGVEVSRKSLKIWFFYSWFFFLFRSGNIPKNGFGFAYDYGVANEWPRGCIRKCYSSYIWEVFLSREIWTVFFSLSLYGYRPAFWMVINFSHGQYVKWDYLGGKMNCILRRKSPRTE